MENYQGMHEMGFSAEAQSAQGVGVGGGGGYPSAPSGPAPTSTSTFTMEPGERPEPPSVLVSVPTGYEPAEGELQVEVSDPHRVGEGLGKHPKHYTLNT
jgi:hypothetical protein